MSSVDVPAPATRVSPATRDVACAPAAACEAENAGTERNLPKATRNFTSPHKSVHLTLGTKKNIRLLEIYQGSKDHPISCKLRVASLDEEYTAVSYRWGSEAPTNSIELNGETFWIRPNLWEFLHQMRSGFNNADSHDQDLELLCKDTESRWKKSLWIDALCIDQEDIYERNHQVDMMGKIYSKAREVLAWLGPKNANHSYDQWHRSSVFRSNPYWQRAWIVQECVLAQTLYLLYGSSVVSSTYVRASHTELPGQISFVMPDLPLKTVHPYALDIPQRTLSGAVRQVLLKRDSWHDRTSSYREFLVPWGQDWPQLWCSDPRDRIYSVIALMDPAIKIVPDYSKSIAGLFIEIIRQLDPRSESFLDSVLGAAIRLELLYSRRIEEEPELVYVDIFDVVDFDLPSSDRPISTDRYYILSAAFEQIEHCLDSGSLPLSVEQEQLLEIKRLIVTATQVPGRTLIGIENPIWAWVNGDVDAFDTASWPREPSTSSDSAEAVRWSERGDRKKEEGRLPGYLETPMVTDSAWLLKEFGGRIVLLPDLDM